MPSQHWLRAFIQRSPPPRSTGLGYPGRPAAAAGVQVGWYKMHYRDAARCMLSALGSAELYWRGREIQGRAA